MMQICVIGAGYWGKNHIKTLYKLGKCISIVDSNNKIINNLNIEYPSVKKHLTVEEALSVGYMVTLQ